MSTEQAPQFVVGFAVDNGKLNKVESILEQILDDGFDSMCVVVVSDGPLERSRAILREIAKAIDVDVMIVDETAVLRPKMVYLVPFGRAYDVRDGRIAVLGSEVGDACYTSLFSTIATEYGSGTIAVDLTEKADPLEGLKTVRARGGFVLAEDYSSPSRAIRSVVGSSYVDGFVDAEKIPSSIRSILLDHERLEEVVTEHTARHALAVATSLDSDGRVDFSRYKPASVMRRVKRRMAVHGFDQFDAYLEKLRDDDQERAILASQILIGVTSFFRDPNKWLYIESALDELIAGLEPDAGLRVWVPGCSTGREAFSLAIVIHEAFERAGRAPTFTVFATDVSEQSLDVGRRGVYPLRIAHEMAPQRLDRWFDSVHARFEVTSELREHVVFCQHDVIDDPPFTDMDLVSCQNVFIYFSRETQRLVLDKVHWSLDPDGLLWLGSSESVAAAPELWQAADARIQLYRAIGSTSPLEDDLSALRSDIDTHAPASGESLASVAGHLFAPACLLVDRDGEVLSTHGDLTPFAHGDAGDDSPLENRLHSAISEELAGLVSTARLYGRSHAIVVKTCEGHVQLEARQTNELDGVIVAVQLLREETDLAPAELRHELRHAHEALEDVATDADSAFDEANAANEELIEMNAELIESNTELEASRQELIALNDELTSVNDELMSTQQQLEELVNGRTRVIRDICDRSPDFIMRLDAEDRVIFANSRVSDEYEADQSLIGLTIHELDLPDALTLAMVKHGDVARERQRDEYFEVETDDWRFFECHAIPELDSRGEVAHVLSIVRDVTKKRRDAEERIAMRERLMEAEKHESLALMAGGIAHDFNNILVGILGLAGVVREELHDDSEHATDLDAIIDSARLASDVAKQLLAYAGRATIDRTVENVCELVQAVVPTLNGRFGDSVEFEISCDSSLHARLDRTQFVEAVTNLAINGGEAALTAAEHPVVTVEIEAVDEYPGASDCQETWQAPDTWIAMTVSDNGGGIPREMRDKMFDPFHSSKDAGRGLGLTMVHGFVQSHDGIIEVETNDDGTTFSLYLPRAETPENSLDSSSPTVDINLDGLRILAVDDEAIVRDYLHRTLERANVILETASTGQAAIAAMNSAEEPFDLLHIDLSLPDMNGLALLETLREEHGDIPAVIFSGYDADEIVDRAAALVDVEILQKPANPREHLKVVQLLVDS